MTKYRFTIYAAPNLPRGHADTLADARDRAEREPDAAYIVKRLRVYPFTHAAAFPLRAP